MIHGLPKDRAGSMDSWSFYVPVRRLGRSLQVDTSFYENELLLLDSLLDGRALENHLEPSYFEALRAIVDEGAHRAGIDENGVGT